MHPHAVMRPPGTNLQPAFLAPQTGKTPLFMWNQKLVQRLPWLHADETRPPMLSVLSDRSAIFEGALANRCCCLV